ncbi:hypothetical protein ACP70R_043563 [Stipagrostis hirtigluma subsp. patula]
MAFGSVVLVLSIFMLSSASHLQAARILVPSDNQEHGKKDPVSTGDCTGISDSPCSYERRFISAMSPAAADAPAGITGDGRGRLLWSTPSDGVGH